MDTVPFIPLVQKDRPLLYRRAFILALITVFYNIAEGVVSVSFGFEDETMALFGFGLDSFVEVISGIGIWHMVRRIRQNGDENPDRFEKQALRITGTAFYMLSAGLLTGSAISVFQGHRPETTLWGVVISLVSLFTMWLLIHFKLKVGKQLNSQAILADAACTKTCLYLSVILLVSSVGYELTGIGGLDAAGALAIALMSFREGREAFEKAKGNLVCGCQGSCG